MAPTAQRPRISQRDETHLQHTLAICCLSMRFLLRLKQVSNASESSKRSGNIKFSRLQSSWRLFCRGVPVSNNLLEQRILLTMLLRMQFSFLMQWASSMIYCNCLVSLRWMQMYQISPHKFRKGMSFRHQRVVICYADIELAMRKIFCFQHFLWFR